MPNLINNSQVWHCQVQQDSILLLPHLNKNDQIRARNITSALRQSTFISARALLSRAILAISEQTNYHLDIAPLGKPSLIQPKLSFNITHSQNNIFLIISPPNMTCGIDCEVIRARNFEQIINHYFTTKECEIIQSSKNPNLQFFTYWTLKEAMLKMYGQSVFNLHNLPELIIKNKEIHCQASTQLASYQWIDTLFSLAINTNSKQTVEFKKYCFKKEMTETLVPELLASI